MPVREKRRRSPGSRPARLFSRPQPPADRRQRAGFSPIASGFTAETDWLLEGSGFEPSVPGDKPWVPSWKMVRVLQVPAGRAIPNTALRGCQAPRSRKGVWLGSSVSLWAKPHPWRRAGARRFFLLTRPKAGLSARDQGFESVSLQRGVSCEPDFRGRIPSMTVGDSSALTKRRLKRMACTGVSSGTAY